MMKFFKMLKNVLSKLFHIDNTKSRRNSVDLNEAACHERSHLDLHCFANSVLFVFATLDVRMRLCQILI